MQTQLKKIPAFGKTIWDQAENTKKLHDVNSFREWLTDKSIVFRDDRRFYFDALVVQGYTVVDVKDLQFWIDEWNG